MTNEQLKKLEKDLWDSANSLRAYGGLKADRLRSASFGAYFSTICRKQIQSLRARNP